MASFHEMSRPEGWLIWAASAAFVDGGDDIFQMTVLHSAMRGEAAESGAAAGEITEDAGLEIVNPIRQHTSTEMARLRSLRV